MKHKLLSIITLYFISVSFSSYDISQIDLPQLTELIKSYENYTSKSYIVGSEQEENIQAIQALFTDPQDADHFNDIKVNRIKSNLFTYLNDVKEVTNNKGSIEANFLNTRFYTCPYYSSSSSENYAIAVCTKEMIIDKEKFYYNLLFVINITDPDDYVLSGVFSKESHKNYLPSCEAVSLNTKTNTKKNINFENNILNQARKNIEKGDELYKNKNYIEAKNLYQAALEMDPNSLIAKERIQACDKLIDSNRIRNMIETYVDNNNYSDAIQLLNELKKANYTYDENWFNEKKQLCELGIKKQEFESIISSGDYYYDNHMYAEAKKIYSKALNLHIDDDLIYQKIQLCNEGDPNYIKNEIQIAYNNAVKSKKYWTSTFRTYLKYEKSGYLTGENYYFMCLMMLENKKVARAMGYSKSLANSLSVEYFFKAKRLGCSNCDMAFLENQVFTNSIYKH